MLPGLYHDINFTTTDRVDRCMTCHQAANRAGYDGEEWPEPYRTHPRPDLFVSDGSPHPYNQFGCTVCHAGLDRATDFSRAGHTPAERGPGGRVGRGARLEEAEVPGDADLPGRASTSPAASPVTPTTCGRRARTWSTPGASWSTRWAATAATRSTTPRSPTCPRSGPTCARWRRRPTTAGRRSGSKRRASSARPPSCRTSSSRRTSRATRTRRSSAPRSSPRSTICGTSRSARAITAPPAGDAGRGEALFNSVGCTGCHIMDAAADARGATSTTSSGCTAPTSTASAPRSPPAGSTPGSRTPSSTGPTPRCPTCA